MVSMQVNNVGLKYPVPRTFSLRRQVRPIDDDNNVGGRLETGPDGKDYVTALEDVSFSLKAGDRLALIGPNGAGKTTLLKLLYGIFKPTTGTVSREGRVDALFNINLGFRADVSGRRNIFLRGLLNGWSPREIDRRMDEIIEFSQLGEFIDMPFNSYSQGMAARLAFATATSFEPEILLMDEWIGAGDAEFALQAQSRMDSIVARAGIIVLASHNLDLLRRVCNKALWLKHGRLEEFTNRKKVLDAYIWRTHHTRLEAAKAAEAARAAEAAKVLEAAKAAEAALLVKFVAPAKVEQAAKGAEGKKAVKPSEAARATEVARFLKAAKSADAAEIAKVVEKVAEAAEPVKAPEAANSADQPAKAVKAS